MKLLLKQDSGKGVSTAAEDNIIPLIYILQAQSAAVPQAEAGCIKPGIDGNATAVAGNIWPRGTKTLIDGEETGMPFFSGRGSEVVDGVGRRAWRRHVRAATPTTRRPRTRGAPRMPRGRGPEEAGQG